jgi:serine acetyltransferase
VPDRCVVAGVPARVVREYVPGDGWTRALAAERVQGVTQLPHPPG